MTTALVVVVALLVLVPGTFYSQEIGAWFRLRAWSPEGPRAAAQAFVEAIRANDVAAAEALSTLPLEAPQVDGAIKTLKHKGEQAKATPVEELLPTSGIGDAAVTYGLEKNREDARITVPNSVGGRATFILVRAGGQWKVQAFSSSVAPN
jgi:hypothetical protein